MSEDDLRSNSIRRGMPHSAAAGDETADGTLMPPTEMPSSEALTGEAATMIPTWGVKTFVTLPDPGYQLGDLIGRGGMGEVVVAQDQRIGREVAVKRIRSLSPSHDAVARFLREARIQARLDHPAIVPVYELGTDAEGRPYFTMKRLRGQTLFKKLNDPDAKQPELLRAFVDVCLAIELAHSRGVVHRDLKPSNIMLGDFGEVYVIDWGVARVTADRTRSTNPMQAIDGPDDEGGTTVGAILGTPGYMAPEQVRGADAGPSADVYALGAILFEILAGQALHPRGDAALATTLTEPQVAPTKRAAERPIAPELDSVCFDALAENPAERPSARRLAERVQAYLDGDRDVERRRALAAEQLAGAKAALESDSDESRATAMRRAGRALALDPDSVEAAAIVTRLMVEPPAKLPPDLVASLDAANRASSSVRSKQGMYAYLSIFALLPLVPFLDIKNMGLQLSFWGLVLVLVLIAYRGWKTGETRLAPALIANLGAVFVFSRLAGPFMLTPILTIGVLLSFTQSPAMLAKKWLIIAWGTAAVALPIVLELTGVMHRTFEITDGAIKTTSDFYTLHGWVEELALIIANAGFIAISTIFALGISEHREEARTKLHVQAWHLQQLLPGRRGWQTRIR